MKVIFFFFPPKKQNSSTTRAAAARKPPRSTVHPAFRNRKASRRQRGHGETLHVCRDARRSPPAPARLQQGKLGKRRCRRAVAVRPRTTSERRRGSRLAAAAPGVFHRLSRSSCVRGRARAPAVRHGEKSARERGARVEVISDPVNRSDYMALVRPLPALVSQPNPVRPCLILLQLFP